MSRVRDDGRVSTKAAALMTSVFLLGAMQALAQETAERSAEAESTTGTIEEVVVTAQKRAQLLQDVPLAISAISTAQIEERGIDNLLDLKALAPNLMVSKYPNSNVVTQVAIRGGVTINGAMYWEPSTGLYLDGVYLGKAVGSVFDVVDIERMSEDLTEIKARSDRLRGSVVYRSPEETVPNANSIVPADAGAGTRRMAPNVLLDEYWEIHNALVR